MKFMLPALGVLAMFLCADPVFAQCYISNCRTDADGTVWCNNQEIPCPPPADASPYEVSEGQPLSASWPTITESGDCVSPSGFERPCAAEGCIACGYQIQLSQPPSDCGQTCSVRWGLPEDHVPPPAYTGQVGGLQGSGSLRGLPNDTYYGNHSDWYSISEPSALGPFSYWPY